MRRLSLLVTVVFLGAAVIGSGINGCGGSGTVSLQGIQLDIAQIHFTATAGDGTVTLGWDTVSGAVEYHLYWSTTSGDVTTNPRVDVANTSYTHTDLTNGTTYYYSIVAEDGAGNETTPSDWISATPAGVGDGDGDSDGDGDVDGDTTAPTITGTSPAANAEPNTTVTVDFSEAVVGVNGTTFTLADADGNPVGGTVAYTDEEMHRATFTLNAGTWLGLLSTYRATIAASVADAVGNALSGGAFAFTFTTRDGVWGAASSHNFYDTMNASGPKVGINNNGDTTIIWKERNGGGDDNHIFGSQYDFSENLWSSSAHLENIDEVATSPALDVSPEGNIVAVWAQPSATSGVNNYIWANRLVEGWNDTTLTNVDDSGHSTVPQVAASGLSDSVAVWVHLGGIWGSSYDVAANIYGDGRQIDNPIPGAAATSPSIAIDAERNATVVWVQDDDIYANYLAPNPETWNALSSTPIDGGDSDATISSSPSVAMNASGQTVAVWIQGGNLMYNTATDGVWDAGGPYPIDDVHVYENPQVAINDNGTFIVVAQIDTNDVAAFWNLGTAAPSTAVISDVSIVREATDLDLDIDANGNAIAVWSHNKNIYHSRFTVSTGTWSGFAQIDGASSSLDSQVSVNPSGYAVAAWAEGFIIQTRVFR